MDQIFPKLRAEYEKWRKKITENDPHPGPRTIGVEEVLKAHYLLCDYFIREGESIAASGPRNFNLLVSAVNRQFIRHGSYSKWKDDYEVCSTLFFGLIKNHPFHDGNKRTALLVALYHLKKVSRISHVSHRDFETLAVRTAANKLDEYTEYSRFKGMEDSSIRLIAHLFHRYTRKEDKREYSVTYNQLALILKRYHLRFENPHGNHIDVVRDVLTPIRRKKVTQKITTIGFPGWTKEVPIGEISKLRKEAELTHEDGVDADVFYGDSDPLPVLIAHYHGTLKRLKDR